MTRGVDHLGQMSLDDIGKRHFVGVDSFHFRLGLVSDVNHILAAFNVSPTSGRCCLLDSRCSTLFVAILLASCPRVGSIDLARSIFVISSAALFAFGVVEAV